MPGSTRITVRNHYTKSDDQAVTGYLATTYVDDLDSTRCAVCISSVFDVATRSAAPAGYGRGAANRAWTLPPYR